MSLSLGVVSVSVSVVGGVSDYTVDGSAGSAGMTAFVRRRLYLTRPASMSGSSARVVLLDSRLSPLGGVVTSTRPVAGSASESTASSAPAFGVVNVVPSGATNSTM